MSRKPHTDVIVTDDKSLIEAIDAVHECDKRITRARRDLARFLPLRDQLVHLIDCALLERLGVVVKTDDDPDDTTH